MIEAEEQALVEKFVAHAAVETLAEAILHRLSWRNEMPDDPVVVRPGEHGVRGELGSVVRDDHAWLAAAFDQRRHLARPAPARAASEPVACAPSGLLRDKAGRCG